MIERRKKYKKYMENIFLANSVNNAPQLSPIFLVVIILFIIYSIFLKGIALWKAARKSQKRWFVVLFLVNTFGILELLYIFIFSKNNNKSEKDDKIK